MVSNNNNNNNKSTKIVSLFIIQKDNMPLRYSIFNTPKFPVE